jgi:predicted transcriptional regulator
MSNSVDDILEQPGHCFCAVRWTASATDALARMESLGVRELVVMCKGAPIGTVSEQDIHRHCMTSLGAPGTTLVSAIMNSNMVRVSRTSSIDAAMSTAVQRRCRQLIVVDADRFVGVVTTADLMRWVVRNETHEVQAFVSYVAGSAADQIDNEARPSMPTITTDRISVLQRMRRTRLTTPGKRFLGPGQGALRPIQLKEI